MTNAVFFQLSSIFYSLLIIFVYFSKPRFKSLENDVYSKIIIINFIGLLIDVFCYFAAININNNAFILILCRLMLFYLVTWILIMTLYIFIISFIIPISKKNNKKYKTFKKIILTVYLISLILCLVLPINYVSSSNYAYSYGPANEYVYALSILLVILWIFWMLKNIAHVNKSKYYPMFVYIFMGTVIIFIQYYNPQLLLMTSMETFVTILMYFTIENPDMKMIAQLNEAKEQAEKANRAKTDFLSSMSHEIRTPLNAITGFSDCILTSKTLEDAKSNATDIISASNTLLETVNGVLDISKIEAGKIEIVNVNYDPRLLFEECAKLVKPRIDSKGLELKIKLAEDLPKVLIGDHINVKKAVINILTNAAKYTDKGYVDFSVNCVNKESSTTLIISVEDTGRGIKKENIDKLFTKFERLDESRNTTIEGTGLGLAITKQIVELMNGKITVQSVYKCGSKFTIIIPQKINKDPNAVIVNAVAKEIVTISDFSQKNILVVDDNKLNLKVSTKLLEPFKANVICVESGFDCIDLVKKNTLIDLILMDDMMPQMSGVETLIKLKELPNFKIPTVALTANAISGMKEKYLNDGFDDYLAKPIERPELNRVLNKFLR